MSLAACQEAKVPKALSHALLSFALLSSLTFHSAVYLGNEMLVF